MWGKVKKVKESEFLDGKNIIEVGLQSLFGKIKNSIEQLFTPEEITNYKLPKVIVIGNESSGKSSLLENITKLQIFPRDSKLCTKCPVHVIMSPDNKKSISLQFKNKTYNELTEKTIYPQVCEIMDNIGEDVILHDEITIKISDPSYQAFEFYDLPGIRAYPPNIAQITSDLTKKYLNDENCIVLCVVPCTITRLTSCQSIALISEMKVERKCILALTMADRLQEENVEDLLINRITKKSDEICKLKFYDIKSIINRTHKNTESLKKHDNTENKWFDDNIIKCIPEQMNKELQDTIVSSLGIENLLFSLNELYNQFIQKNWKPKILNQIKEKKDNILIQYKLLGEKNVNVEELNNYLKEYITEHCYKFLIDIVWNYYRELHKVFEVPSEFNYKNINQKINQMIQIVNNIKENTLNYLISLVSERMGTKDNYVLCRFTHVNKILQESIKETAESLSNCPSLQTIRICIYTSNSNINNKIYAILNSIIVEYVYVLCEQCFPKIEQYEECEEYAKERKKLENIIEKYDSHTLKISQLV